ncbi:MAG TPA: hypothetical protein VH720_07615 [Candidatus Limnocylindrales bacterium]
MDAILGAAVLVFVGIPVGLVGAWFVSGGASGLAPAFQPAPSLDWPAGVQEDDDFHWTWSTSEDGESGDDERPAGSPTDRGPAIEELEPGQGPRADRVRRG